ncbi:MAG TPA: four helix bundle protein [Rhodothermales bacterium]|nr:four helix bundle protein [Rhodothermales bacterium]
MAKFERFEEITAWRNARALAREVYSISNQRSFGRDYGLRDQIRRAAVSVGSNIAEGFERHRVREFYHFLSIAKGSAGEVRSQLYVALDQGYIDQSVFDHIYQLTTQTARQISALMSYLERYQKQS